MRYKLDHGSHSVYSLQYHLIQVVKYRREIFDDPMIVDYLKQRVREISETFGVNVINQECDRDHIHILFRSKPVLDIPRYVNALKTNTSREIRRNFPQVEKKLWKKTFWSPSYFLATTGEVTLDILKQYVESQGKNEDQN